MTSLREDIVDEISGHAQMLPLHDLVRIIESEHPHEEPGIPAELAIEYVDAAGYETDRLRELLETRTLDDETWREGEYVYRLEEDRISTYPREWHDRVRDADGLLEVVEFLESAISEPHGVEEEAITQEGVAKSELFRVVGTITGSPTGEISDELTRLDEAGEVEVEPEQHPHAMVRLTDDEA